MLFLHADWLVGVTVIIGVGFTLTVNVLTAPGQLAAVGVTVNTPAIGAVPELVAVNEGIVLPLPLKPIPIAVVLLFHV